jgi:hypothetical protein
MSNHAATWSGAALAAENRGSGVADPRTQHSRFNCASTGRFKGFTDNQLLKRDKKNCQM